MSQDSGSAAQNNQEIDLDDIDVEIMIIAKNPKTLGQASAFLTRRGWPTVAMSNLAQAVETAAERKPDFVLISLNHQHPALPKFIELMQTNFGSTCVAFVENMDTASNSKLNKSSYQYKVFGQMSGPNLHRSIRRILADKLNIGSSEERSSESSTRDNSSDNISVKGGSAADGRTMVQKSDPGATHGKGAQLIKSDKGHDPGSAVEENEVLSSGKYTMSKTNRRSLKDLARERNEANGGPEAKAIDSADMAAQLKKSLFGEPPPEGKGPAQIQGESTLDKNPARTGEDSAFEKQSLEKALSEAAFKKQNLNKAQGEDSTVAKPASAVSSDDSVRGKEAGKAADFSMREKKSSDQSMIERAVQAALERICQPGGVSPEPVERIETVGVFPIDSPAMPGYLVLAWPNEYMKAEEAFFQLAQETLKTVFIEMGVQARLELGFYVQIPQVDFVEWTGNQATFNLSLTHRERELRVAFFSTKKPLPKATPVEGDTNSMYSIGLDHISTDQPVTFKAYLHLKKNKKYFLYLRNGRQLQPEQKARLKENKVKDFYMKSVDIENLRTFLAASYLRETISKKSEDEAA